MGLRVEERERAGRKQKEILDVSPKLKQSCDKTNMRGGVWVGCLGDCITVFGKVSKAELLRVQRAVVRKGQISPKQTAAENEIAL